MIITRMMASRITAATTTPTMIGRLIPVPVVGGDVADNSEQVGPVKPDWQVQLKDPAVFIQVPSF